MVSFVLNSSYRRHNKYLLEIKRLCIYNSLTYIFHICVFFYIHIHFINEWINERTNKMLKVLGKGETAFPAFLKSSEAGFGPLMCYAAREWGGKSGKVQVSLFLLPFKCQWLLWSNINLLGQILFAAEAETPNIKSGHIAEKPTGPQNYAWSIFFPNPWVVSTGALIPVSKSRQSIN